MKEPEEKKTVTEEKKTVTITTPRLEDHGDPNFFIGINGKNYILPRDESVEVPPEVAEEFERSQRAERAFRMDMKKRAEAAANQAAELGVK